MDEAEREQLAAMERTGAALDEILDRHLGPRAHDRCQGPHRQRCGMDICFAAMIPPDLTLSAMNPRLEREKLLKVGRLAREFVQAWLGLHRYVSLQAIYASQRIDQLMPTPELDSRLKEMRTEDWFLFWVTLGRLDELVDKITPTLNDFIDAAPAAGRRKLVNVAVVECLGEAWQERKNAPAPKGVTDAGGAFYDFISEAFQTLHLEGDPRAAVDSWASFRKQYPKIPLGVLLDLRDNDPKT
jgi:hypothetical protein